ncbi:malate oxidoreductase [Paenibacillus montaniterrae]|uniref:Malate oxidoreductase n=1 Tax=Paenibacillus montaniterrae TaxID=429341 RepID=A0A919YRX6_9BACL|nr:NAD-dependent malic enzyme [Paenibacillus montaniterrae]GIP17219.1 malate oxidoreductase [Paenibacillus montaniterrae]
MAQTTIVVRLESTQKHFPFGQVATLIDSYGGEVESVDIIRSGKEGSIRDITVSISDQKQAALLSAFEAVEGLRTIHVSDRIFLAHLGGKIRVMPSRPIKTRDDLSHVYTPGVAKVCEAIQANPDNTYTLTIKRNSVAVISDGTAVLGLGNIGPHAAIPVMEGKAMLFKQLANVDAFPICLDTQNVEEIIHIVKAISPIFGGINIEDISSPRCFEVEQRLINELDIPVFHDDQHGTAIVVLAGLYNALKLVDKKLEEVRIVVNGVGAAGSAICKMLLFAGAQHLIPVDREGIIARGEHYEHPVWNWLASQEQVEANKGTLHDAIVGADVFIGVSKAGVLKVEDVKKMNKGNIVFAMANPNPEIEPDAALPHVSILATGRSDYPNQINNVLVFPGMFRGALDCRASRITESMKLAAAQAIAEVVSEDELDEHYIVPSIFNEQVVRQVSRAVIKAAIAEGVARRVPNQYM